MDVSQLTEKVNQLDFDSFGDDDVARGHMLSAARALVRRLETPTETAWTIGFHLPALYCALKVAKDNGIFDKLDEDGGRPKSTDELFPHDPNLMRRMLRHLGAMSLVKEVGPDRWAPTRQTSSFRRPEIFAPVQYFGDITADGLRHFAKYLQSTNYEDPKVSPGSWQDFSGDQRDFYTHISEIPHIQENFTNMMKGYTSERRSWLDPYPAENLLSTADLDGPLVVDLGGGADGHDLAKLLKAHPETSGRLVSQDLGFVVAEAEMPKGITAMVHDFFKPQAIKGARAYFMHSILHNWPDAQCREILRNLLPAFRKGYSSLLINDVIIPATGANPYDTSVDLTMGALLTARERNEDEWTALLESEGFKIVKFWKMPNVTEGVVEAIPA